ncbi:flagellar motor protein MotA, partial [Arthrobacter sp. AK-YN10]
LWGLLSANFIWLPISAKLKRLSELEVERMNLVMEGLLAVQSGTQPLLLAERLRAMVPADPKAKNARNKADDGGRAGKLTTSRAA